MHATARLAGFFAAHAIWCVSEAESLIPILAFENNDDDREMVRLVEDDEPCLDVGRQWIEANPEDVPRALLAYDGYLEIDGVRNIAIVLEVSDMKNATSEFVIAVPYRPVDSELGFAVHRPKFLSHTGAEPDYDELSSEFFSGVEEHEQGAQVWATHMDESE